VLVEQEGVNRRVKVTCIEERFTLPAFQQIDKQVIYRAKLKSNLLSKPSHDHVVTDKSGLYIQPTG